MKVLVIAPVNWLNKDKSLREQGIDETQVLTLRKKLFFSDQNVDCNDPVQLNLLFVQVCVCVCVCVCTHVRKKTLVLCFVYFCYMLLFSFIEIVVSPPPPPPPPPLSSASLAMVLSMGYIPVPRRKPYSLQHCSVRSSLGIITMPSTNQAF